MTEPYTEKDLDRLEDEAADSMVIAAGRVLRTRTAIKQLRAQNLELREKLAAADAATDMHWRAQTSAEEDLKRLRSVTNG